MKRLLKKEKRKAPVPVCVEGCADGGAAGDITIMSISGQRCRPCAFC